MNDRNSNENILKESKKLNTIIVFIIILLISAIALTVFSIHSYNEYHSWIKNYASLYYDDVDFYGFSMADYALARGKSDYNKYKISMCLSILLYISDLILIIVYIKKKRIVKSQL